MPTIFTGQGSVVSATSGAGRRVAITAVANTTPIQISAAGHGFLQTDTVLVEGTGIAAIDGKYFQANIINSGTFSLLGTSASGTSTTGYAIDYQLQPAIQVPAGGDLVDPGAIGAALEGCFNPVPFLYAHTGKWRLHNQYSLVGGAPLSLPHYTNPWSSNSLSSASTTWALASSAQWSLQSLSDTTGLPSYAGPNEFWEWNVSMSALIVPSQNNILCSVDIGAAVGVGTGVPSMIGGPFQTVFSPINSSIAEAAVGISLNYSLSNINFASSNLYFSVCIRTDSIPGGQTCSVNFIGVINATIKQYRPN